MAGDASAALLRNIQTLFDIGTVGGLSDRELLARFAGSRDASAEAAFEALVLRHGPMVLRVCSNVLRDPTDAQDAFQATFLVLVRRSRAIRKLESVGSWLYGVAYRVAARARVEAARRRAVEQHGGLRVVASVDSETDGARDQEELGPIIQEEVRRLPERYRGVVVLCYWEGLTHEQAATQLGCPLGTVRSRLARARGLLHRRLTRRGLAPLAGLVAASFDSAQAAVVVSRFISVPSELVQSTVRAAGQVAAGKATAQVATGAVALLVQQVLRSMLMMKLKTIAIAMALIGVGAFGASLAARQADSDKPGPGSRRGSRLTAEKSKAQPRLVTLGNYVVEPPDVLLVEVLEALPGRPISGERQVRPDGKISLGFYGDVYVAGKTLPEIKVNIIKLLQKYLEDSALDLTEMDATGEAKIDERTKQPLMKDPKDSATVFVDVAKSNSKNFYVLGAVAVTGRLPVTGKETILDAISKAGGLTQDADHKNVFLYRPDFHGGPVQSMRVDIDQIMMGDDLSTNYQLFSGDRLVVPQLKQQGPDATPTDAEHPAPSARGPAGVLGDFVGPTNKIEVPVEEPSNRPSHRVDRQPPFGSVENRLSAVERKLDLILELLKSRAR